MKIVQHPAGIPSFFVSSLHIRSRTAAGRLNAGILLFALGCLPAVGQTPAVKAVYCAHENFHGSGTVSCSVTLAAKAGSSGVRVTLESSAAAAKVPATVLVSKGTTHVDFIATIAPVAKTETATLTAKEGSSSKTFSIKLAGDEYGLSVSAVRIPFGDVTLRSPATQSVTLKSTGAAVITVSSAKVTGTGFSLVTHSFPLKLNSGETAVLDLEFDPEVVGAQTGTLTITSDSSAGSSTIVALMGTGEADEAKSSYQVNLSWNAPADSAEKIAGYRIYRAAKGSSTYGLLNSAIDSETSYKDDTVAAGVSYDYYVKSVDTAGVSSAPSGVFAIAVP